MRLIRHGARLFFMIFESGENRLDYTMGSFFQQIIGDQLRIIFFL